MKNLELVFLGTFISSLVLLLSAFTLLVLFIVRRKQIKATSKKKSRSKSKRREQKKRLEFLRKSSKRALIFFILFLFLGISAGAGAGYVSYYQAMNLSEKDEKAVVDGYYLISDFEKQLEAIKKGDVDQKKAAENIQNLGGSMASYSGLTASELNKEEGQLKLNRFYNIVKELGVNASAQYQDFFDNNELVDEFLSDTKKAKGYQSDVFKFYKVDQNALKKNE
ncbi:hypothetical protein P7H60_06775 [Vagococcus carniphilus]|uniref:hypothetical protein n=1 Tax=Vagococcus carniphilus TaxID=218144 RepID=UPI002892405B|nr:hypothetical protein [Vagococcus carniphilus]MDT2848862.1 hypothetical protein [Vagococcus carniphilus]